MPKQSGNHEFLDAKNIPKFQFELLDEQLINCIRQLYLQSKNHQKIINQQRKQIQQKLSVQNFIDSIKQIETNIVLQGSLQNLLPASSNNKDFNDPLNPVLTNTIKLSNKFSLFSEILTALNAKLTTLEKRVFQTEQKINQNVNEKVSSLEDQLTTFVKDYRTNFKDLENNCGSLKIYFHNKSKQIETNTLWKINECSKRLEDRPNIEMVKNALAQLEIKLEKMFQTSGGSLQNFRTNQTAKLQQDLIKLKKLVDFNTIQLQSKVKLISDKLENSFMSLKFYANQKLQITKKFDNLGVLNSDLIRKEKANQSKTAEISQTCNKLKNVIDGHNQHILKINQKIQRFTKNDQFAKLLQKIDPHQICRLSSSLKNIQQKNTTTDQRIETLKGFAQTLRSKMQFWNVANGSSLQKTEQNPNRELITRMVKEEINSSDLKPKIFKLEQQFVDVSNLKEAINEILKKIGRTSKDTDLTAIKYEIQGVQEYIKRENLILANRLSNLENSSNSNSETKKRPLSARGKEDGKLYASLSTKKLIPVNCISCHQTNTILTERERKTVFNSKFVSKAN